MLAWYLYKGTLNEEDNRVKCPKHPRKRSVSQGFLTWQVGFNYACYRKTVIKQSKTQKILCLQKYHEESTNVLHSVHQCVVSPECI